MLGYYLKVSKYKVQGAFNNNRIFSEVVYKVLQSFRESVPDDRQAFILLKDALIKAGLHRIVMEVLAKEPDIVRTD